MVLIDCSECEGKVSDKASTCPHCGLRMGYSANATKQSMLQRRIIGAIYVVGVPAAIIFPFWLSGEFEHGGSFDWFSTEPEVIYLTLKEFVKKTPSTHDDLSLDRHPVKDIAVIKSIPYYYQEVDWTADFVPRHEIKSTISGVEYVFDIVYRLPDGLAIGDKIEFTALVDPRDSDETDRNLRNFEIERVISMVSHFDCSPCYGTGRASYSAPPTSADTESYRQVWRAARWTCRDCQGSGLIEASRIRTNL